jgi:hypothetical protein
MESFWKDGEMVSQTHWSIGLGLLIGVAGIGSVGRAFDAPDGPVSADDEIRAVYLRQRAEERADAQRAIDELAKRQPSEMTPADYYRLFRAYNELGPGQAALEAINQIPEAYLAEHKLLDSKVTAFHNVNFSIDVSEPMFQLNIPPQVPRSILQELLFYDRCLDRGYGNAGEWYWRKAKRLCRMSVWTSYSRFTNSTHSYVINREQYEYAFELVQRAFEVEPNLLQLDSLHMELMLGQPFTLLETELRFQQLIERHTPPADAEEALQSE